MAAPAIQGSEAIAGLRQQITANAAVILKRPTSTNGNRAEAFEVLISSSDAGTKYRAILIYRTNNCIAAEGADRGTVVAALGNLLQVTADLVEAGRGRILRNISTSERMVVPGSGGVVDRRMLF